MAETVKTEQDDFYWAAGSALVQVMIDNLNESLKENGITEAGKRCKICSEFAFGFGNFLDQYWMEINGQKRYSVLCFTHKFLDIGTPIADVESLHLPVRDFEFHGAASEVSENYFGTQEEQLSIRVGLIGEE